MTTKHLKRGATIALFLCLLTAMVSGMAVRAGAASDTRLPEGFLIGDQDGVNADAYGYYYIDARSLLPGDVIRKTLTIQNLSQSDPTPQGKIPYTLVMTAEPLFSRGPIDLLDTVHLNMQLDGDTVYDGRSRGDGTPDMTIEPLFLGLYGIGDRSTLEITLSVARDMRIHEEKSEADFRWHFYAYRALDEEPAKTGVLENYKYLLPVGMVVLLFVMLVLLKKRRDGSKKRQ